MSPEPATDKPAEARSLRKLMRQRRAALPLKLRTTASLQICQRVLQLPELQRARRIAIYIAVHGEVDCRPLIHQAWLRKKRIFAPVLAQNRLFFAPLKRDSRLRPNRFKIPEPRHTISERICPHQLDVVIMPLTAFDACGNRLGMGAGYYDRTFAFRKRRRQWRKPLLIGVAYSFQQVDNLPVQAWDVPMDRMVTDNHVFRWS